MAPLNLASGPSSISVRVNPTVLLNICDAFIRRNSRQSRVVGTLLGYFAEGVLEVKNCFTVPHQHTPDSVSCKDAFKIVFDPDKQTVRSGSKQNWSYYCC